MNLTKISKNSRFYCLANLGLGELSFSLVDYRNNYFTSDNPDKILEFYNGFDDSYQLIKWMKERPRGVANIHEVDGSKDIIVVIPTVDFNGKYAKECRNSVFKGLHIIFVESGIDFYFNYAHNCNVGIRTAMEYNPTWVIVSNDDMYKIDDISLLQHELEAISNTEYNAIFTKPSKYHSIPCKLSKPMLTRSFLFIMLGKYRRMQLNLEKKFGIRFFLPPKSGYWRFLFGKGAEVISIADFGIYSSEFIKKSLRLYDDVCINSSEDMDVSLRVYYSNNFRTVEFRIGDYMGSSLGNNSERRLRDLAGMAYVNHKLRENILK